MADAPQIDRGSEDYQQAEWLARKLEHGFKYDHTAKRWHHFDGIRWAPDKTGLIVRRVAELATEHIPAIALDASITDEERKRRIKVYRRLLEVRHIEAALKMLATFEGYGTDGSDWDQNPYLLGCANGIVDLRTGTLRTGRPEDLVTRSTNISFNPQAPVPERFAAFLHEVTSGDAGLWVFFMQWFGYSLFGLHNEHRFLILSGLGRNGKGVLVSTMRHVFGEYSADVDQNLYAHNRMGPARSDQARADLMALKGRRMAAMSEPDSKRFNEEMLKAHTGGDPITARALNSNNVISWLPTHTITFLTNRPPAVDDIGPSMASRVMVADFRERYEGDKEDKQLQDKLDSESEGILRLLVEQAAWWWENRATGIVPPQRVIEASEAYLSSNDPLGQAIEEAFVVEQGAKGRAREMYADYVAWYRDSGREGEPMSETGFSAALRSRGFTKKKTESGMVWLNIRPLSASDA